MAGFLMRFDWQSFDWRRTTAFAALWFCTSHAIVAQQSDSTPGHPVNTTPIAIEKEAVPRNPTNDERAEIEGLFAELYAAMQNREGLRYGRLFDLGRTMRELSRQGALAGMDLRMIMLTRLTLEAAVRFGANFESEEESFARYQPGRIHVRTDGTEAQAFICLEGEYGDSRWSRWWLVRGKAGWRVYDHAWVASGKRMTHRMVETAAAGISRRRALQKSQSVLDSALGQIDYRDPFMAARLLETLDPVELPPHLAARYWLYAARVSFDRGQFRDSIDQLAKARGADDDLAMLDFLEAQAHGHLGNHEQSLAAGRRFLNRVGADDEIAQVVGAALVSLGKSAEAEEVYRSALAARPTSVECLVGLAGVLPAERMPELTEWFDKLANPRDLFQHLMLSLQSQENPLAMHVLIAAYRKRTNDDSNIDYYEGMARMLQEQYAQAAHIFDRGRRRAKSEEEQETFESAFLDAMLAAGRPLEGYEQAADKPHAFSYLSQALLGKKEFDTLDALVSVHRKSAGDDPWVYYYAGLALAQQGKHEAADESLAQGMRLTLNREIRETLRSMRVSLRYKAGRGLEAYRQILPRRETFEQLAQLYLEAKDAVGLSRLVMLHGEADSQDPVLPIWQSEAAWLAGDYAAVVQVLVAGRDKLLDDGRYVWRYEDLLVRSLLRLERFDEAESIAVNWSERDEDPWYLLLVAAARGDVEMATRYVTQCIERSGYDIRELYGDADLGPALRKDRFSPLRKKFPPPDADSSNAGHGD